MSKTVGNSRVARLRALARAGFKRERRRLRRLYEVYRGGWHVSDAEGQS